MRLNGRVINNIAMYGLLTVLVLLLQTTCGLEVMGIKPNYALAITVAVAIFEGPKKSAVFGMVLGFLCDCTAGHLIGYFALILMLSGVIVGQLSRTTLWRNLPATIASLGAIYAVIIVIIIIWFCLIELNPLAMLPYMWLYFIEFLISAVCAIPAYFMARFINTRLAEME